MQTAKKASLSSINNVRGLFKDIRERECVMQVVGVARTYSQKVDDNLNTTTKFEGEFIVLNRKSEVVVTAALYVPEVVTASLIAAISKLPEISSGIEFAFSVFAVPDEAVSAKYRIEIVEHIKPEPTNALRSVLARYNPLGGETKPVVEPVSDVAPLAPAKPSKKH